MTEKKTKTLSHTQRMILWLVSESPSTCAQLTERAGVCRKRVDTHVRNLVKAGLLFASGSVKTIAKPATVYSAHVKHPDPSKALTGSTRKDVFRLASILASLENGPMTEADIADHTSIDRSMVSKAISYHRKGGRCTDVLRIHSFVYVEGRGNGWKPAYTKGPGPDAVRPKSCQKANMDRYLSRNGARVRARRVMYRLKTTGGGSVVAGNPFAQLYAVTGTTYCASGLLSKQGAV